MRDQRRRRACWLFLATVLLLPFFALGAPIGTAAVDVTQFRVRVLNAVQDSGVDVWLNDRKIGDNLAFRAITTYTGVPQNSYEVQVYAPGKTSRSDILVHVVVPFFAPNDYTVIVFGKVSDNTIAASVEPDANSIDGSGNTRVRFGNYLPNSGTVALATAGTNIVLGRAGFAVADRYTPIGAGAYNLFINNSESKVLAQGQISLAASTVVSIFLLAGTNDYPDPVLLVSVDAGAAVSQSTSTPPVGATATPIPAATSTPAPNLPTATPVPNAAPPASTALRNAYNRVPPVSNTATRRYFTETGHTLQNGFKRYWDTHGGVLAFGYPLTEEFSDSGACGCNPRTVQYFEKGRLEYYPEFRSTPAEVQVGPVGRDLLRFFGLG